MSYQRRRERTLVHDRIAPLVERDALWQKLCEGGRPNRCGWLTDKYGLSWQIIPTVLGKLLQSKDREASNKAMKAMLAMDKLDIRALQNAFDGR